PADAEGLDRGDFLAVDAEAAEARSAEEKAVRSFGKSDAGGEAEVERQGAICPRTPFVVAMRQRGQGKGRERRYLVGGFVEIGPFVRAAAGLADLDEHFVLFHFRQLRRHRLGNDAP